MTVVPPAVQAARQLIELEFISGQEMVGVCIGATLTIVCSLFYLGVVEGLPWLRWATDSRCEEVVCKGESRLADFRTLLWSDFIVICLVTAAVGDGREVRGRQVQVGIEVRRFSSAGVVELHRCMRCDYCGWFVLDICALFTLRCGD